MATKTKNETQVVGIIGQMYEDRKSKRVGVLESREEKYKTLMLRDKEGKSFNITYSTFRSNWRKYNGEEIIQTSTQVSEERAEEKRTEKRNKETVERKSEVVKMSTDDKVKAYKSLEGFVASKIKPVCDKLVVSRTSKGCVCANYKRTKAFEVWTKFNIDAYDIFFSGAMTNSHIEDVKNMEGVEYTLHDSWSLKHGFRVPKDKLESVLDILIPIAKEYIDNTEKEKQEEK